MPEMKSCPLTSIITSIKSLENKQRNLKKTKSKLELLINFNDMTYELPKITPKKTEKRKSCAAEKDLDALEITNLALAEEVKEMKVKLQSLQGENAELSHKYSNLKKKRNIKVQNQKLKRKELQLNKYKVLSISMNRKCKLLDKKLKDRTCPGCHQLPHIKFQLKKVRKQLINKNYYSNRQTMMKSRVKTKKANDRDVIEKLKYYEVENSKLRDELEKFQICSVKADGKTYSDKLREVIYYCISKNVSLENMESIITFILSNLARLKLLEFPSVSCLRKIEREMGVAARLEIARELSEAKSTTIKYDGTTKVYFPLFI
jgi:hypothetical protein